MNEKEENLLKQKGWILDCSPDKAAYVIESYGMIGIKVEARTPASDGDIFKVGIWRVEMPASC